MNQLRQTSPFNFDNSYSRLAEKLFARVQPSRVSHPKLTLFNSELALSLGLNATELKGEEGAQLFTGNIVPNGALPIAQAYAGHQFGHYTMLGDGRAILLGEHVAPDGQRYDVQLKGSGPTPFSRRGDGRAALGPMLREYIISEALYSLGIPTSRSLAVASTGETVYREDLLKGAVLTRVARSHIRVGTFEYVARLNDLRLLKEFADYTIARHYPESRHHENPYLDFLKQVALKQAQLIVQWMGVGFIHGVMNTDNMAISGESIDFGPCAFMDEYNPETVFSSIDRQGRYAYGNQSRIALWNLSRFAETLLPLIDSTPQRAVELAEHALSEFPKIFDENWLDLFRLKIGLRMKKAEDLELIGLLLKWMQESKADFTNTFRTLSRWTEPSLPGTKRDETLEYWQTRWSYRLDQENRTRTEIFRDMDQFNPAIIPRNHRVEHALQQAQIADDLGPLHSILKALRSPYSYDAKIDEPDFRTPPTDTERIQATFCGT